MDNKFELSYTCLATLLKGAWGQAMGFEFDKEARSRKWAQFKSPHGERLIVPLKPNKKGQYFYVNKTNNSGGSYYRLRKIYGGGRELPPPSIVPYKPDREGLEGKKKMWTPDRMKQFYSQFKSEHKSSYLHAEKRIPVDILAAYNVKTDALRAVFLGFDDQRNITSITFRNSPNSSYKQKVIVQGERGLVFLKPKDKAPHIIICESAVDCLSHASLAWQGGQELGNYISLGGGASSPQLTWLKTLLDGYTGKVILALDNDKAGEGYTDQLRDSLEGLVATESHPPENAKDWSDVLKAIHI